MLCRMSLDRVSSETAISPRAQLLASRLEARHASRLAQVDVESHVKSLAKVGATSTTTTTNPSTGESTTMTTNVFGLSDAVWQVFTWAGTGLGAYHGYKRNNSIGWGIGWGLLGGMFPLFTLPVAFAQGFGKRAKK
jgi:hypothetical protein